jgi:hypothetical protein
MSGNLLSTSARELVEGECDPVLLGAEGALGGGAENDVTAFVRTPFDVRRNVVKVWRPLPANLWTGLAMADEDVRSKHRERLAIIAVVSMATVLLCGVSAVGYREVTAQAVTEFPLLGGALAVESPGTSTSGWYFAPWQMLMATLWVVAPSLAGWFFVRALWIPLSAASDTHWPTLAFARNLSGTYFYVYLMITAGAVLLPLLILVGAERTSTVRWCLWCFLFGESFFVPAVMWSRLVFNDSDGAVFGRRRYWLLSAYVLLFVIIPIIGMALENSRSG